MSSTLNDRLLVLTQQSDNSIELENGLSDALQELGLGFSSASRCTALLCDYSLLWVPGDICSVQGLFAKNRDSDIRVDTQVSAVIQEFYVANKPIVAPCLALPIILESLSNIVPEEALTCAELNGVVVYYPKIRTISTNRTLLGQNKLQKFEVYSQLLKFTLSQYR